MAAITTPTRRQAAQRPWDAAVELWLAIVACLILAMITVGGATRLTDSGLSITEWQPILGAIPPLNEGDWQQAFAKYQEIPEYHLVNKGMSIEAFKAIYWWEWSHRFLGRFIGIAFAAPLLLFWLRGALRPGYGAKFAGVLALGALQGGIGWFMVKSGLVDRVDVSQYRLALHLTVAFLILSSVVWLALDVRAETHAGNGVVEAGHVRVAKLIVALIFLQVVLGGFVAGLKAGLTHNTWPLMNGAFVPDEILTLTPWYHNPFENPVTAQFDHRLAAYAVVALVAWHTWTVLRHAEGDRVRRSVLLLVAAVLAQASLGVWTLLEAVPVGLGIAHQAGAALLLVTAVRNLHIMTSADVKPRLAPASA